MIADQTDAAPDALDLALLAKLLTTRVEQADPEDLPQLDVDARLQFAGASFRSRVQPLTYGEIRDLLRRLQTTA